MQHELGLDGLFYDSETRGDTFRHEGLQLVVDVQSVLKFDFDFDFDFDFGFGFGFGFDIIFWSRFCDCLNLRHTFL
jgi:hypothetical protein